MKMTRVALAVSATIFATSALATNGTNMTGVGAQSSAMGGTGVAAYYGAENVVVNPGMIGKSTGTEFSFGGTLFTPEVQNNGVDLGAGGQKFSTSDGDTYVIPSVSLTSRINDSLTFGIGMYGTSGMGVDYGKNKIDPMMGKMNQFEAQSNLQIMRFVPTLAFNKENFGIGFSPIIQYGSLDINYNMGGFGAGSGAPGAGADGFKNIGKGAASDLGYGFSVGGYFDINKDLTIAASYTSAIDMKYDGQLSSASEPFAALNMLNTPFSDDLEQPAELKVGVAYQIDNITLTGDFKQIKWGDAKGYKDFGWEDQNVISLGAKYQADKFWVGAGYNKADNPIKHHNGSTPEGAVKNMFNTVFFPAISEQHFSLGGGYNFTKAVAIDAAIVISPEETVKADLTAIGMKDTTTKHSQAAYTVSVRYNF